MNLPLIPYDKSLHGNYGGASATFGALVELAVTSIWSLGLSPWWSVAAGADLCLGVAVLREIYNRRQGGVFDLQDIAATLIGGAVVLAPLAALLALVSR